MAITFSVSDLSRWHEFLSHDWQLSNHKAPRRIKKAVKRAIVSHGCYRTLLF